MLTFPAGSSLARRLLEAVPKAEDLDNEFQLLDDAVRARNSNVLQSWEEMYDRWVHVNHKGTCPFEAADALKRKSYDSYPFPHHLILV
jgi:hypothetical protein